MVRATEDLRERIDHGVDFHEEIFRKGLVLV
jgi:hypothetical protein